MKKKKTTEQPQADFKNNPFRSLKGLSPSPPPAVIRKKTASAVRLQKVDNNDEDDASLFLRAAEGAKRIDRAPDDIAGAAAVRTPKTPAPAVMEDSHLFLAAMQKIGTTFRDTLPEQEPEPERRSATSRMRQLKRGTIRISQELDLHGYLKAEALARLERLVADAFGRGQQAVLVITGKGINSPEGPVLPGAVAEWLRHKSGGRVAEFSPAPRELGGSGAVVVFLKKA